MTPTEVEVAIAELAEAGFSEDQIEIITRDEIEAFAEPLDHPGPIGLIGLFLLGDELLDLMRARNELARGESLIGVSITRDDDPHRVADILRRHGGHGITHFGRWTITFQSPY